MDINIRKVSSKYPEIKILCNNTVSYCGLFDEIESVEIVKQLIAATEELLPANLINLKSGLSKITKSL